MVGGANGEAARDIGGTHGSERVDGDGDDDGDGGARISVRVVRVSGEGKPPRGPASRGN